MNLEQLIMALVKASNGYVFIPDEHMELDVDNAVRIEQVEGGFVATIKSVAVLDNLA